MWNMRLRCSLMRFVDWAVKVSLYYFWKTQFVGIKSENTSENASFFLFSITNYIINNLCETLNRKFTLILKWLSIWCLLFALMSAAWSSDVFTWSMSQICFWFGGLDKMLKLHIEIGAVLLILKPLWAEIFVQ